jgi:hypothetical protein
MIEKPRFIVFVSGSHPKKGAVRILKEFLGSSLCKLFISSRVLNSAHKR